MNDAGDGNSAALTRKKTFADQKRYLHHCTLQRHST